MNNTIPNARLYLRSDAGSRLLIDFSRNGAFADDPTELVDNSWNPVFDSGGGPGEGDRTGPATTNLSAGAYTIRLQYEEGTAYEDMHLMRDGGISLAPYAGKIYRINGVAGRRLFFDSLDYHTGLADWELYGPEDLVNNLAESQEDRRKHEQTNDGVPLLKSAPKEPSEFRWRVKNHESDHERECHPTDLEPRTHLAAHPPIQAIPNPQRTKVVGIQPNMQVQFPQRRQPSHHAHPDRDNLPTGPVILMNPQGRTRKTARRPRSV